MIRYAFTTYVMMHFNRTTCNDTRCQWAHVITSSHIPPVK
jgi:hypothetical protein